MRFLHDTRTKLERVLRFLRLQCIRHLCIVELRLITLDENPGLFTVPSVSSIIRQMD